MGSQKRIVGELLLYMDGNIKEVILYVLITSKRAITNSQMAAATHVNKQHAFVAYQFIAT